VQGFRGATPYVRWGNYAVLVLLLALIAAGRVGGSLTTRSSS
jgi:apolipoprotein N-acyltransferase